jgi:hypothetical protein
MATEKALEVTFTLRKRKQKKNEAEFDSNLDEIEI